MVATGGADATEAIEPVDSMVSTVPSQQEWPLELVTGYSKLS